MFINRIAIVFASILVTSSLSHACLPTNGDTVTDLMIRTWTGKKRVGRVISSNTGNVATNRITVELENDSVNLQAILIDYSSQEQITAAYGQSTARGKKTVVIPKHILSSGKILEIIYQTSDFSQYRFTLDAGPLTQNLGRCREILVTWRKI